VLLYKVYRDDAAFDVHRDGPSITQWREETAGMTVKICVTRCEFVCRLEMKMGNLQIVLRK